MCPEAVDYKNKYNSGIKFKRSREIAFPGFFFSFFALLC